MKFLIPKLACLAFIFIIVLFITIFVFPSSVFAKVIINEILPHPSSGSDWIELYNTESGEIDIGNWQIEDSTSAVKTFSNDTKIASSSSFLQVFVSNRLNNGGDIVRLNDKSGVVIDEKSYGGDPGIDISIGRYPDGSDNWGVLLSSTPNSPNIGFAPTFTPTPLPTSTSVPTKKPSNTPHPSATSKPQNTLAPTNKVLPTITKVSINSSAYPTGDTGSAENDSQKVEVLGSTDSQLTDSKEAKESSISSKSKTILPLVLIFIVGGFVCIGAAVVLSYKKIRSRCI